MSEPTSPLKAATPVAPSPDRRPRLLAGARLALFGVLVNCALATIKVGAGYVGHSYALIADGIESTLDIFSSLVIWAALGVAARPPDETPPYGHGKAEPMATIVVSLFIIFAALGLAAESVHEIITPHHAPASFTLAVLVGVVIIKEWLSRRVAKAGAELGSGALETDAWHHRADSITSAAAFIGIAIALVGGPGYEPADDWAALFACGLIGYNGWTRLYSAANEVMDVAPPQRLVQTITSIAAGVRGVVALEQCRIRKMGVDYFVDIHVEVQGSLTVREGHEIAHAVKDAIRRANPAVVDVLVHIEPHEPAEHVVAE